MPNTVDKLPKAAFVVVIRLVCVLQGVGVAQCFVASQEEAERMPDEYLFDMSRLRQDIHHFGRAADVLSVQLRNARAINQPRRINRLSRVFSLESPVVVVTLERHSERIHFLVAPPAFSRRSCQPQPFAKRLVLHLGHTGVDADRYVRH